MQHVCLIQSISARKATHIKMGTWSGSCQCQLRFSTKIVSIGWSGCEWLLYECKNAHFQAFPPLSPAGTLQRFPKIFLVFGVKQSDISHITLASYLYSSPVSPSFYLLGPHNCYSLLVWVYCFYLFIFYFPPFFWVAIIIHCHLTMQT